MNMDLFIISQKISNTAYRLDLPDGWNIHNVFRVSCLIPARDDTILGQKQEPPAPVMMETGEEWEIERILREKRTRGGVCHYLVKWLGFDESENKWLAKYELTHAKEAISEFLHNEAMQGKTKRQRTKGRDVLLNVVGEEMGNELDEQRGTCERLRTPSKTASSANGDSCG